MKRQKFNKIAFICGFMVFYTLIDGYLAFKKVADKINSATNDFRAN